MSENIHNDDSFFKDMYGNFQEEPSSDVWDKLNAKLDKRDALFYRTRSLAWKRSALALFLLLLFFVGYEYGFKNKANHNVEITKTRLSSKQVNGSATAKLNFVNPLNAPRSSSETLEERNDTSSKIPVKIRNLDAVQSSTKIHMQQEGKITHNNNSTIPGFKKNNITAIEKTTAVLIKDRKGSASLKNGLYGDRQPHTHTQNGDSAYETIVSYGINNSLQRNAQNKLINTDTLLSVRKEKNNTTELPVDSNILALLSPHKQTISTGKINSLFPLNKADSNALASAGIAKKSAVQMNRLFKPHWSFSTYLAADFSGRLLDDDDRFREPNGRNDSHELDEREKEQFGYSLGVIARYQFSKKWLIKTGLVLANQSTRIAPQTLYALSSSQDAKFKYVTSSGYAYINPSFSQSTNIGDSIISQMAEEHLSYLTIPTQLSYIVHAGKRFSILPGIGITTNVLLQSKISTEVHGDDQNERSDILIRHLKGLERVNFSVIADAEMHYKIKSKWSIMLLPSFKYALDPITKQNVVKTYPYNFGLGFGITYGL